MVYTLTHVLMNFVAGRQRTRDTNKSSISQGSLAPLLEILLKREKMAGPQSILGNLASAREGVFGVQ